MGIVGSVRPEAVIAAADADAVEHQENPEKQPAPAVVAMNNAVPGHDCNGGNEREAENGRYAPIYGCNFFVLLLDGIQTFEFLLEQK